MLSRSFAIKVGILFAVLLTVSAGSFAQKVRYNYLPGTDFTRFKTYKWAKVENGNYPNQILDEQLMRSIDAQLTKKGLTKVDEGIPDLAVVYQVAVDHDKEWNAYGTVEAIGAGAVGEAGAEWAAQLFTAGPFQSEL